MAKYGSDDLKVEVDNASDTLVDLSQYVDEIDGVDIEALIQESHAFGDAWVEQLYSGVNRVAPITLAGFYDDTVTVGPNAILNALGATRTLKITWGSTKTTSVECVITNYRRLPVRNESTRFSCTLTPTAAVTEV
ncbi:hypothetical protein LCGC14_1976880 [marine sediment metagenome]|uniref:Uncharacterized protein n=1 Tax=marine sediment metagenome TaxID=412755 RepID=A0A0F9HNE9_9ZZZZ